MFNHRVGVVEWAVFNHRVGVVSRVASAASGTTRTDQRMLSSQHLPLSRQHPAAERVRKEVLRLTVFLSVSSFSICRHCYSWCIYAIYLQLHAAKYGHFVDVLESVDDPAHRVSFQSGDIR